MLKGSCLCKAVTYTLDEELSELVFCHCSFCRKATASAYTVNAKVSSKNLVLHGEKNSWLPIVHLQENNAITVRTVIVKFSLLKKIYQKSVL